jgi:hypothetical protein
VSDGGIVGLVYKSGRRPAPSLPITELSNS